jgi:hypothetical protein
MHLTPEELIDIAEGTRRDASAPHLRECEMCRRQVAELRATMSMAADVNVPEPSPLFWDHFSSRVHDAVAGEPGGAGWSLLWARFRVPIAIGLAPAMVVFGLLGARVIAPRPLPSPPAMVFVASAPPSDAPLPEDSSFALVVDLTGAIDVDTAEAAGLAGAGSAEHAVTHMTGGELRELRQLLQQEIANSGD